MTCFYKAVDFAAAGKPEAARTEFNRAAHHQENWLSERRKEIAAGYDTSDTIGWCGEDGAHAAFPVVYRQLLPKKVDNLLCAGRCLGRGDTIDTFRLIGPCFVTGQAAGVAAALAAKADKAPREVDIGLLRKTLRAQGAYVA